MPADAPSPAASSAAMTPTAATVPQPRPLRWRLSTLAIYAVLTVVVWGLFAADRGLIQDDASALFWVRHQARKGVLEALFFTVTPTRLLANVTYTLAGYAPDPILALHLSYGAAWLGLGLLAHALAGELLPGRPRLRLAAGALTLCASADFLTNSPISLGYHVAACAAAAAVLFGLKWRRTGKRTHLGAAGLALAWSLWTYEAGLPSVLLAPLLFWVAGRFRFDRRLALLGAVWAAVLLPWSFAFLQFLTEPGGYASRAVLRPAAGEWLRISLELLRENFTPWRWVFARPVWFSPVERVIPLRFSLPLVSLAVAAFLAAALARPRRQAGAEPGTREGTWTLALGAGLLLLTYASNAIFVGVISADFFYRTHIFSKLWASILVALLGDWLEARLAGIARVGLLLPAAFVGYGAAGGLERQDFYLSSWRSHRAELASILQRAPALREDASLVLYCPLYRPYKATEAEYLARAWLGLLTNDSRMPSRVFLWSESRKAGCEARAAGLRCWEEGQEPCFRSGDCAGALVPYDRLVLLSYAPRAGRYEWNRVLAAELLGEGKAPDGYRPRALVRSRTLEPWVERRLFGPWGLARFLPVFAKDEPLPPPKAAGPPGAP